MRRALLLLGVTAAIAGLMSLATSGAARAEDAAVTCHPSVAEFSVQPGGMYGVGRASCSGDAYWAVEACFQMWVRPDDQFYDVGNCGRNSGVSGGGEAPTMLPCSYAGYGEYRLWVHVAWENATGWHDAYTSSNVAWACSGS